jgi:hypothetical protein
MSRGQRGHEFDNPGGVFGEELANQRFPFGGEGDDEDATVLWRFLPMGQVPFFKVADHHGEITASSKDLLGYVRERHRAEVVKGFEYRELRKSKASSREVAAGISAGGIGSALEANVSGKCEALLRTGY